MSTYDNKSLALNCSELSLGHAFLGASGVDIVSSDPSKPVKVNGIVPGADNEIVALGTEIADLTNEIFALTTRMSSLMPKPVIYTLAVSGTVRIGTTISDDNIIFRRLDTVVNADIGYSGELPFGVYTVSMEMNGGASTQLGLYKFHATAPFVISSDTNDRDNIPAIELPITCFHHASRHGNCRLVFIPKGGGPWQAHLVFSSVDPEKLIDTFTCTVKFKREYWG
jgi:hypothetical protein